MLSMRRFVEAATTKVTILLIAPPKALVKILLIKIRAVYVILVDERKIALSVINKAADRLAEELFVTRRG